MAANRNIEGYVLPFDEDGMIWSEFAGMEGIFLVIFTNKEKLDASPLEYTQAKVISDQEEFLFSLAEQKFLFRIALDPFQDGEFFQFTELFITSIRLQ